MLLNFRQERQIALQINCLKLSRKETLVTRFLFTFDWDKLAITYNY